MSSLYPGGTKLSGQDDLASEGDKNTLLKRQLQLIGFHARHQKLDKRSLLIQINVAALKKGGKVST